MQQRVAHEEVRECRVKRPEGKLVAGKIVLHDCKIAELELWGEFFADPQLDELLDTLKGLDADTALQKAREILDTIFAEPKNDIMECIERLLEACRRQ
ncbi:hypothetical protein Pyrfu_0732 [Pyrolobus fumarii 1A]|uniref:Lipoate--protein ligase n=1 Tax=Pyrolobus fumarii (strain DSM 11204 / 1A) TaxID=694429 RepID=G0ED42_PYRF1|nr:hypothetical protein [Pyrolobus fumarii]AEM38601.1 hypothetical protein Pyrfu_0732 [Pyrolobus fumarii 1A]